MRERQRLWKAINAAGGYTLSDETTEIPTIRVWLGDKPRDIIAVPTERFSAPEIASIERAFPEAAVMPGPLSSIWREGDEDTE